MTRLISKGLISVATASVLMTSFTGCMDSKSTTGSETQTKQATGSVVGLVQDTNGNALSGVTVYLAGKQTTTDAGGIYRFDKVPVTNVAGGDANTGHAALSITIAAPTGYLGATVTVTPMAQIDDAEDNGAGSTVANGTETFIDGFLAEAGVAVLPALTATVTGRLEMTGTGADVENQPLALDLTSVNAVAQQQAQNGVTTTYATGSFTTTTGTDGKFTFTNVPADSLLALNVGGEYTIGATNANTTGEDVVLNLGDIITSPVVRADTINPWVAGVVGRIPTTSARAMLEDDVRQTFVINFSESIDTLSEIDTDVTNSVNVYSNTAKAYLSHTATITAANQVTVVLDTALGDNVSFDINMLITDFKDKAGNMLALNADNTAASGVSYDSIPGTQYVRLQLNSYNDLNQNATAVTAAAQMTVDTSGTNYTLGGAAINPETQISDAFNDVDDSDNNVTSQLNATEAGARLDALATTITGGQMTVDTNETRVTFTPSGATSYSVAFKTAAGAAKYPAAIGTRKSTNIATLTSATDFNATNNVATLSVTDANPAEFVIEGAAPTDTVTITPNDDFGYAGTPLTFALVDNVAPTAILQTSYQNASNAGHNGAAAVVAFGDGGELSNTGTGASVGTPYLGITNGLLDNLDGAGVAVSTTSTGDQTLQEELFVYNTVNTTVTPNVLYITKGLGIYDLNAWNTFNTDAKLGRTIGVAFSEDISLNGATPTFNGTSTLSSYTANNNVTRNDDNLVIASDLIDANSNNVLTLANTDHGSVVDFTGIADAAGNVATAATNAKVVVRDMMAPFVSKAEYNGAGVVVAFNEPIQLVNNETNLTIYGSNGTDGVSAVYTTAQAANWTLSSDSKTLTVATAQFGTPVGAGMTLSQSSDWNVSSFAYANNDYNMGATTALRHGSLEFKFVKDAKGNSWRTYNTAARAGAQITAPRFAVANTVGDFTYTTANANFNYSDNTTTAGQTVIWTFTHPILTTAGEIFSDADVNATSGTMQYTSYTKINTWFSTVYDNNGTDYNLTNADASNPLTATLSADKKSITLVFTTTVDVNDTLDVVRERNVALPIKSAYDTTKTQDGINASPVL